jgi:hypothetical protein
VGFQPCCFDSIEVCDFFGSNETKEGLCLDLTCKKLQVEVSGVPEWNYYGDLRFDLNGVYEVLTPDSAEYGKNIVLNGVEYGFILYPYKAGGIEMSWTLYCHQGCQNIWLMTSEFSLDVERAHGWEFAGQGGTVLCDEDRDYVCWHDTLDLTNIDVRCGLPSPDGSCSVTEFGQDFPGITADWCNTNCFDDGIPIQECSGGGETDVCIC